MLHIVEYDMESKKYVIHCESTISALSSSAVASRHGIFVFGGTNVNSHPGKVLNSLYRVRLQPEYSCTAIAARGTIPTARYEHAAVLVGDCNMYIFGGIVDYDKNLNCMYRYDILQNMWYQVHANSVVPQARSSHCMCAYQKSIFLFGGLAMGNNNQYIKLNDLHVFDTVTQVWIQIHFGHALADSTMATTMEYALSINVAHGNLYLFT